MISPLFRMTGDEARGLLFGLLEADKVQLRKHQDLPSMRELIGEGKVKYDAKDPQEHWKTYREIVEESQRSGVSYADCEDLAVAVAAEDQIFYGIQSLPFAYSPREGLFHVVTAVPSGAIKPGSEVVSGQAGQLPCRFGEWPLAMGSHSVPGYVLQDPSRAAGMGSFGYAPSVENVMPRYAYGEEDRAARSRGRGIGGAFRKLQESVLGGGTGSTLNELRSGVLKGAGMDQGWAGRLGEKIPSALGIGRQIQPKEQSAVKALRKGMDSDQGGEAPSQGEDDASDFDDEDLDSDDEEFGGLGDAVVSEMFGDDEFGDDLEFDDDFEDDLDEFGDDDLEDEFGGEAESFAGIGTLRRGDLFAGEFRLHDIFDKE